MESSVVSSSHLPLVPEVVKPIEPPLIIFTVLGTQQNTLSAAIIATIVEELQRTPTANGCKAITVTDEAALTDIDLSRAVALFDDREPKGLFTLRYTRRFCASRNTKTPSWVANAKWAVVIHRNKPDRIARQIVGMFVTKFDALLKRNLLPQAPPPHKKRKPRKPRVKGAKRSQYFMS